MRGHDVDLDQYLRGTRATGFEELEELPNLLLACWKIGRH